MTHKYKKYMELCEELGAKAAEKGDAPVGCIILKGNEIIAEAKEAAHSKKDVTCHAEIIAIRKARKKCGIDMSDCTLITTHEPCVMCAYAIRFHKIETVIYKNHGGALGSINSNFKILNSSEVPAHWGVPPRIIQNIN